MLSVRPQRACFAGFLCLFCAVAATASAQEPTWAEKMFDQRKIDFGVVAKGSEAVARVKITNFYKQKVHIAEVTTTCGCSAGKPSKTTLDSMEEGFVEVTMNTHKFDRRKDSNLIITIDAPVYSKVTIPITAYIRTDVVFDPGAVNFGAVDYGKEATRKIKLRYAGRANWHVKEVRSRNEYLLAKAVETARGGGRVDYDIVVTLAPNAPVGAIREQLTVVTDDPSSPQVPLLVEANVEADVMITPAIVSLGLLKPGEAFKFNIVIKGKQPIEIEKIECESDTGLFKVRLPMSASQVHVVPMTITAPDKSGTIQEQFSVTVTGRPQPITFKAMGRVAERTGS